MIKDTILMLILGLIILFFVQVYLGAYMPVSLEAPQQIITISEGSTIKTIAYHLESAGLIRNATIFYLLSLCQGKGTLKAGEYALNPAMSPIEILERIKKGAVFYRKLTIPEGFTIFQVADFLDKEGWAEKERFLSVCSDPNILKMWNIQGPTAEGYLFPETYFFTKGTPARQILQTMIKHFWKVFTPNMAKRAEELGYSVHQILTIASFVEKETALAQERSLVSAVFHNRLKEGIPLQCDPSVIYGLKDFNGNLTKLDLRRMTPYNTYRKRGLPPGPIANPGLGSIMAALYPANVGYKYFVSRNDGSHIFSETLKEHNRAVFKYQKRRIGKL